MLRDSRLDQWCASKTRPTGIPAEHRDGVLRDIVDMALFDFILQSAHDSLRLKNLGQAPPFVSKKKKRRTNIFP